jgi:hypothetical protein
MLRVNCLSVNIVMEVEESMSQITLAFWTLEVKGDHAGFAMGRDTREFKNF